MAISTILHIGEDVCRRIPVMEIAGFMVFHCKVEIPAIDIAFDRDEDYSAIVFQNDTRAVPEDAVQETRSLSEAPLVLFQNPTVDSDGEKFDLVIPALTPPEIWLQKLRELIQVSQEIRERSLKLRKDCADAVSISRNLRARCSRNRVSPVDPDAPWRGNDTDGLPDSKAPERAHPEKFREKAG